MGTAGDYDGLDRFGRIVDLRHVDFDGGTSNFVLLKYKRDRNGNPTVVDDNVETVRAWDHTFDNLNRLTVSDLGILDTAASTLVSSSAGLDYAMDLLGNFGGPSGTTNGITLNKASGKTIQHIVNATNEITTLDNPNPGEPTKVFEDPFGSLSGAWAQTKGTWSASGVLNVDALSGSPSEAIALVSKTVADDGTYAAKIKFPTSSSSNKAGLILSYTGTGNYYAVVIDRNGGKFQLYQVSGGTWTGLANAAFTASDSTWYKIKIVRWLKYVDVRLLDSAGTTELASLTYDAGNKEFRVRLSNRIFNP